jgi:predicted benzoate:H+ symporter BenE
MGLRPLASAPEETRIVNPCNRTCGGRNTLTSPIGVRTVGLKRITAAINRIPPDALNDRSVPAESADWPLVDHS